mmetsp:Transcript_1690/g.5486  ORF Transcript_1690/g.5486 Transcript_1690/m.5486 type:complete len:315 (-) Transcript_1690:4-948(-)
MTGSASLQGQRSQFSVQSILGGRHRLPGWRCSEPAHRCAVRDRCQLGRCYQSGRRAALAGGCPQQGGLPLAPAACPHQAVQRSQRRACCAGRWAGPLAPAPRTVSRPAAAPQQCQAAPPKAGSSPRPRGSNAPRLGQAQQPASPQAVSPPRVRGLGRARRPAWPGGARRSAAARARATPSQCLVPRRPAGAGKPGRWCWPLRVLAPASRAQRSGRSGVNPRCPASRTQAHPRPPCCKLPPRMSACLLRHHRHHPRPRLSTGLPAPPHGVAVFGRRCAAAQRRVGRKRAHCQSSRGRGSLTTARQRLPRQGGPPA